MDGDGARFPMDKPGVTIRIANAKDYAKCLPLLTSLYRGDIGPDFRQIFRDYVTETEGVILLAESPDDLVGILVGSFHLDIDWEGRTSRIDAIVVKDAGRRMGTASKLAQCFAEMAKRRNCRAMKSRINTRNVAGQRFHESLGFTKANTYEYVLDFQENAE